MPASWPVSSADPRRGVSESRLRKPVWMSRARSVPAFMVEKSAPWMNGTASAKARNESVGNPGSIVDAFKPPALTSISATGKISGGIALAGWRAVRRTERSAIAPTWTANALICRDVLSRRLLRLPGGALQRAPGLREEDVVERRRFQLDVVDHDAVGVHRAHDVGQPEPGARRTREIATRHPAARRTVRGGLRFAVCPPPGAGSRARWGARSPPSALQACPRRRCGRCR